MEIKVVLEIKEVTRTRAVPDRVQADKVEEKGKRRVKVKMRRRRLPLTWESPARARPNIATDVAIQTISQKIVRKLAP